VEARLVGSGLGEDLVLTVVLDRGCCPVVGLVLGGWDESDFAVEASVVVPVDVLGDGDLDVDDRLPAAGGSHHGVAAVTPDQYTFLLNMAQIIATIWLVLAFTTIPRRRAYRPDVTDWLVATLHVLVFGAAAFAEIEIVTVLTAFVGGTEIPRDIAQFVVEVSS